MNTKYDYDYSKLKGRLREKDLTYKSLASILNISKTSVSERMNNNAQFTQEQIDKTIIAIDIPNDQIDDYFFTHKVQKN